jgi:uncharacterized membrane protein YbhN (UPF0104 family)
LRRIVGSTAFKSFLAVLLLGYLIYLVDFREIMQSALGADMRFIAAALLLLPLNVLIEGSLWHRITGLVMRDRSRSASFGSLMSGHALGFFTPARIGELAGRSFYLDYHDKWSLSALVMFQRMLDMLVGVTIGLVAIVIFVSTHAPTATLFWSLVIASGVVVVPALAYVLIRPGPAFRILSRILRKRRFLHPIAFLRQIQPRHISPFVALATCRYLTFVGQFVLLVFAFGASTPLAAILIGAGMTFFGKYMIPSVTIMDIGVREGSAVFFMGAIGVLNATAFNASLFLFAINLVIPAALGIPFVMRLRMNARDREKGKSVAGAVEHPAGVS